jgi:hypothetical protein
MASADYILVKMFLVPFAIFQGLCQPTPLALQMLLEPGLLHHYPFVVE